MSDEAQEIATAYEVAVDDAVAGKRPMPTVGEVIREWAAQRTARDLIRRLIAAHQRSTG